MAAAEASDDEAEIAKTASRMNVVLYMSSVIYKLQDRFSLCVITFVIALVLKSKCIAFFIYNT